MGAVELMETTGEWGTRMRALLWIIGLFIILFTPVGWVVVPALLLYALVGGMATSGAVLARDISKIGTVAPAYIREGLQGMRRYLVAAGASLLVGGYVAAKIIGDFFDMSIGLRVVFVGLVWLIVFCVFGFMESMRRDHMVASSDAVRPKSTSPSVRTPDPVRFTEVPAIRVDLEGRTLWLGDKSLMLTPILKAEKWKRKAGPGAKVTECFEEGEGAHRRVTERRVYTIRCSTLEEEEALIGRVNQAVLDLNDYWGRVRSQT
jgi:hypothetical protein